MNGNIKLCGQNTYKVYSYFYSKEDKSSIFRITGSRKQSFRLPILNSTSLQITARYLIIQIRLNNEDSPTITLTIGDDAGNHFNFAFSTVLRKERPFSSSQTSALINLNLQKNIWINVCFDLQEISSIYWPNGTFQVLDSIEISPTCSVRYIYAGNESLNPSNNGLDLPKSYKYQIGRAHV